MEYVSFRCDDCGERIEDLDVPVIVKEVVGIAPGAGPEMDVSDMLLSQRVWEILRSTKQNAHLCHYCHAWRNGHDLLDKDGNVVVLHADFQERATFKSAIQTAVSKARPVAEKPVSTPQGSIV